MWQSAVKYVTFLQKSPNVKGLFFDLVKDGDIKSFLVFAVFCFALSFSLFLFPVYFKPGIALMMAIQTSLSIIDKVLF